MKSISLHQIRVFFVVVALGLFVVGVYVSNSRSLKVAIVESAGTVNTSGFVWSENVGWIELSGASTDGTPYGVTIDTTNFSTAGTGAVSGFAWSEHIGWVSFDRSTAGNPPEAPFNAGSGPIAQIDWSTGKVTGWARAIVGVDGWDGWIKLSDDANTTGWAGKGTSVVLTGIDKGKLKGWAWGSDVVGWIDMAAASTVPGAGGSPTVILPGSCTEAGVDGSTWSACATTAPICTAGVTQGTQTGSCASGGTFTRPCTMTTCPSGGSCANGAVNPTACTIDGSGNCLNGATNPPTCTTGIGGAGTCTPPNGKCETGESVLSCPQDCKPKIKEF